MESAFGVDHGDVSKGLKPAQHLSMARVMTGAAHSSSGFTGSGMQSGRAAQYSRARLAGNKKGAQAAVAKPGNRNPAGNPDYSPTSNGFKIMSGGNRPYSEVRANTAQARLLAQKRKP